MQDNNYQLCQSLSLKDRVYSALKNEIIVGALKPGTPLNLIELCNKMNISAAPLREAINMLAKDGFVMLNPRKHAIVSDISFEGLDTIIYLRSTIEPYAARISIDKIPQSRIASMRFVLRQILDCPTDAEGYVASDLALHELLHQYAGSRLLSEIITTVKEHSIRLRYSVERFEEDNSDARASVALISTMEHLEILDALESRNEDKVYSCVYNHIMNFGKRLKDRANLSMGLKT